MEHPGSTLTLTLAFLSEVQVLASPLVPGLFPTAAPASGCPPESPHLPFLIGNPLLSD